MITIKQAKAMSRKKWGNIIKAYPNIDEMQDAETASYCGWCSYKHFHGGECEGCVFFRICDKSYGEWIGACWDGKEDEAIIWAIDIYLANEQVEE